MRPDLFLANQPEERGAQNVCDASVFHYAAHCSRILLKQKYSESVSSVLQTGCFGGTDLLPLLLQSLSHGTEQLAEVKHALNWSS